jgi:hypothetical protein
MKIQSIIPYLILALCLIAMLPAVQAQNDQSPTVIYQTTFSTAPNDWVTNNPTTDFWDSNLGMYHFAIEPSTGSYAYVPVEYDHGPFTLEYDVILNRVDEGATFRFGFSGSEMDPTKGPSVLTQFTNAKFGKIMWLHLVTPGNRMVEVNSQKGDTLTSGPTAYDGPTVKYELNKTYHITVNYDAETRLLSTKVNEKNTGRDIWSYYVTTGEDLHGMNRIYLGSKGDYGMMNIYAQGFIDNVRLTAPAAVTAAPTAVVTEGGNPVTTLPTAKVTTRPVSMVPTAYPTQTPQSPSSGILPVAALCIAGVCLGIISLCRRD